MIHVERNLLLFCPETSKPFERFFRANSQMDVKYNQTGLFKLVFESRNERNVILQNERKLKRSGVFVLKRLPFADRIKRREAEKSQIKVRRWRDGP